MVVAVLVASVVIGCSNDAEVTGSASSSTTAPAGDVTTAVPDRSAELEELLRHRPLATTDPDRILWGKKRTAPTRTASSVTEEVATALARRLPAGQDPHAAAETLMQDARLLEVAPDPGLRGALALFTGTLAEPVLTALREPGDVYLSHVRVEWGDTTLNAKGEEAIAKRVFACAPPVTETKRPTPGSPDSEAIVNPEFESSRLESIAAILFHELLHTAPESAGLNLTSRDEHVTIYWLEVLMWAQEIAVDPALARASDRMTGEANARLVELLNSGGTDVAAAWFDPFLSVGDISTWSAHEVEPAFWRLAILRLDLVAGTSVNAVLPAVLDAAEIAEGHAGARFDDELARNLRVRGRPLSAAQWLTVIEQLEVEPVGVQVHATVSGGSPPAGRLDNEWVAEEGPDRDFVVAIDNVSDGPLTNVQVFISDDGDFTHPRATVDLAQARLEGPTASVVTPTVGATPSGPNGEVPLQIGDLAAGQRVTVHVPAKITTPYRVVSDGMLAARVGTDQAPVIARSASTWSGVANGVSLLQPKSADQQGPSIDLPNLKTGPSGCPVVAG